LDAVHSLPFRRAGAQASGSIDDGRRGRPFGRRHGRDGLSRPRWRAGYPGHYLGGPLPMLASHQGVSLPIPGCGWPPARYSTGYLHRVMGPGSSYRAGGGRACASPSLLGIRHSAFLGCGGGTATGGAFAGVRLRDPPPWRTWVPGLSAVFWPGPRGGPWGLGPSGLPTTNVVTFGRSVHEQPDRSAWWPGGWRGFHGGPQGRNSREFPVGAVPHHPVDSGRVGRRIGSFSLVDGSVAGGARSAGGPGPVRPAFRDRRIKTDGGRSRWHACLHGSVRKTRAKLPSGGGAARGLLRDVAAPAEKVVSRQVDEPLGREPG